jgi:hypothetical protein
MGYSFCCKPLQQIVKPGKIAEPIEKSFVCFLNNQNIDIAPLARGASREGAEQNRLVDATLPKKGL